MKADTGRVAEGSGIEVLHEKCDLMHWGVEFKVEKYHEDIDSIVAQKIEVLPRELWTPDYEEALGGVYKDVEGMLVPWEVREGEKNGLANAGINLMWNLIAAAGGTAYSNANSYLGVGDSATAFAASQTDLQASTNKLRKAMQATYPVTGASQKATFKSSFGTSEANFVWNEWATFNASTAGTMLNRKVESLGTKSTGTWHLTVDITIT